MYEVKRHYNERHPLFYFISFIGIYSPLTDILHRKRETDRHTQTERCRHTHRGKVRKGRKGRRGRKSITPASPRNLAWFYGSASGLCGARGCQDFQDVPVTQYANIADSRQHDIASHRPSFQATIEPEAPS